MNNHKKTLSKFTSIDLNAVESVTPNERFRKKNVLLFISSMILILLIVIIPIIIVKITKKKNITTLMTTQTTMSKEESTVQMITSAILISQQILLSKNSSWKQNGTTIAGGHGFGDSLQHLKYPQGIIVDDEKNLFCADWGNHRIVKWKYNNDIGEIVVGNRGQGNLYDQLNGPMSVITNKQENSLIICDGGNKRVIQWFLQNKQQQTIVSEIDCSGLAMDKDGFVYVADDEKDEIRRWKIGEKEGTLIAGGNGKGNDLNQLNAPFFIHIDKSNSLYVSDKQNNRVMKWKKDAKEGIVVAGGIHHENTFEKLNGPTGLFVTHLGQIFVIDSNNNRIMRWNESDNKSEIVVGQDGSTNFYNPTGLSFDIDGNLYVADWGNDRIQRFDIEFNSK
ncbi:unnamed protein product [Adineta ricciae]|uniref:SMP-30/Gluconolactonase/LRE-like region domain-containing protein n=1 Tax=Adineta ricciae TaxID=249248 RepID=A0A813XJ87_ADIRI|nr:unnamed protein product [Adineta ricciae]CAF1350405.1 unnamed protein product [Adineta ricciae]